MAKLSTTQTFSNGDQVTATTLTNIIGGATIASDSVDSSTITVSGAGVLSVGVVQGANIGNGTIDTDNIINNNVTLAKIEQVNDGRILANLGGTDPADVSETLLVIGGSGSDGALFDNDNMLDNDNTAGGSATRGATQQSIKAYVDSDAVKLAGFTPSTVTGGSTDGTGARHETITLPNGLVMKVGAIAPADPADTTTTVDFSALTDGADFPNAVYSANVTWEKTGSFATGQMAYIDSLNKENLVIDHTAGATLIHYVVYGR
jgi:hypothetical protein